MRRTLGEAARRHRFLIVFALLSITMGVSVGVAKIATSLFALHLGAGPAEVGLITSGGAVGMLVMSLPIGFMVDHWGPRRLFVIGSFLGGSTYALLPWASTPWFLLGASTAIGFFMPLRFVSLNSVFFEQIRTLGDGKAGWSRAMHMSGMFLIGPMLGAVLVAGLGFAATWWLIAASFAVTIMVSPLVMGRYGQRKVPAVGHTAEPLGWRGLARDIAALLRDPELREANLIDFVSQGTTMYTTTFVILIAIEVFHLGAGRASAYVTGWGGAFIATLLCGGMVALRLGARHTVLLGLLLVATALVVMGLAPGAAWLWPGVLLQGVGAGLVQLVNLGRIARAGVRFGSGRVAGLNLLIAPLGGLLGSGAGGLLGQHLGLQTAFLCFLPGYVLLALWQLERQHRARANEKALCALGSDAGSRCEPADCQTASNGPKWGVEDEHEEEGHAAPVGAG